MVNKIISIGIKVVQWPFVGAIFSRCLQIFIRLVFQLDIKFSKELEIGIGTRFIHNGIGSVIHHAVKIGENCMIYQGVTIGANVVIKSGKKQNMGTPIIGNNVVIFSGAVIVGPIVIGDNSVIGANCVVTRNIPSNSIVKSTSNDCNRLREDTSFNQITMGEKRR